MKFFFNRNGIKEESELERWGWLVGYNDGTNLKQFETVENEQDGIYHQFNEIDQSKLDVFIMEKIGDASKRLILPIKPGMKLIHFYRNIVLNLGTDEEERFRLYCFGYIEKGITEDKKVILEIWPNDEIVIKNEK